MRDLSEVALITPVSLRKMVWKKTTHLSHIDDNRILIACLIGAVDGIQSWLRTNAYIPLTFWSYQHHALAATTRTMQPYGNITRQIFHGYGILTFFATK
ncbi:MAG: hypothetical protein ACR5K4_01885 [Sodalis sp. (in: enterobacteria)]